RTARHRAVRSRSVRSRSVRFRRAQGHAALKGAVGTVRRSRRHAAEASRAPFRPRVPDVTPALNGVHGAHTPRSDRLRRSGRPRPAALTSACQAFTDYGYGRFVAIRPVFERIHGAMVIFHTEPAPPPGRPRSPGIDHA